MAHKKVAVLLMAHGGPDSLDDVEPILRHIMKDRMPSVEVVSQIKERYRLIGGKSPLLEITERQAKALEAALNGSGGTFCVYVGMRHWTPFIHEVVQRILDDFPCCLIAISLAPHYSKMSVGAYIRTLDAAWESAQGRLPLVTVKSWADHPLLLDAFAEKVTAALLAYPKEVRSTVPVIFTAHSLPEKVLSEGDPYRQELEKTVEGVVKRLGIPTWYFAYQSRGMAHGKWLGPDVTEMINALAEKGEKHLLLVPIGFVSDHVEILYDIDIFYKKIAEERGMLLHRTESLNVAPLFIKALAEIVHAHLPVHGK